jgi:hypothetical protein
VKTVVVATYRYRHEGEVARTWLESAGIPCILVADDAGGFRPEIMTANPVRILVREEDAEDARELLADSPADGEE